MRGVDVVLYVLVVGEVLACIVAVRREGLAGRLPRGPPPCVLERVRHSTKDGHELLALACSPEVAPEVPETFPAGELSRRLCLRRDHRARHQKRIEQAAAVVARDGADFAVFGFELRLRFVLRAALGSELRFGVRNGRQGGAIRRSCLGQRCGVLRAQVDRSVEKRIDDAARADRVGHLGGTPAFCCFRSATSRAIALIAASGLSVRPMPGVTLSLKGWPASAPLFSMLA